MHVGLFRFSLQNMADEEQWKKFFIPARDFDIWGCYAQTELGHGSNVQGLETTAIFDHKTDEFVINTPTITATKWWPGELGRYAQYALVFAQLQIPEEDGGELNDYGVSPFIV